MLQDLFSSGILNIVYAVIVLVSFLFAVISLLGAEVGDALDLDADADGDFDLLSVSPFALAMFGAAFGLTGLIARLWLEMEAIPSILVATVGGLVIGGIAQAIFVYFFSPSRSSHYSLERDAKGREAEVIITIPAEGLGQIAYNNISGRVTVGARSTTDESISSGDLVIIEKIVGRIALVRPVGDE